MPWAEIIAVIALVASIGPRAYAWIVGRVQGAKVRLRTQDSIGIAHHLGRAWLLLHIQIENTGKKAVAIENIEAAIRQVDFAQASPGQLERFPARMYFSESKTGASGGPFQVYIGAIHLQPGEIWQQVVRAYGPRSEEDEEKALILEDRMGEYIARIVDERGLKDTINQTIDIEDAELLRETQEFATHNLTLRKGRYELFVSATDWDKRIIGVVKHSFSVSELNMKWLHNVIEGYRHGPNGFPYQRSYIEPRLSPPEEGDKIVAEYSRLSR